MYVRLFSLLLTCALALNSVDAAPRMRPVGVQEAPSASQSFNQNDEKSWFAYRPREIRDDQLQAEYDRWKTRHLALCGDGSADVRKEASEAVSEGTGYGLLLAVSMGDRATFDRLLAGFQRRKNSSGMMSWRFALCGAALSQGAATDADLDIAMALVMADHKWGGYRGEAEGLISSIKRYAVTQCNGFLVLRPGDHWGACLDANDQRLNPSYFAPAYYREFSRYMPQNADFWLALAYDSYRLLNRYQQNLGGLLPDWAYVDGGMVGSYGYEACRVPWRIAMDFAWHGQAEAQMVLQKMHDYVAARGGPEAATDQKNSCFVGGLALTATAVNQDTTDSWYRLWLRGIPEAQDPMVGDNPYYQGTLRVLYMLLAGSALKP